jgi:hypothetical protein
LDIGATSESDITETVIVSTLVSVLGGLGVTASNILDFTYTSWTASRRLSSYSTTTTTTTTSETTSSEPTNTNEETTNAAAAAAASSSSPYVDVEGLHISSRRLSGVASVSVNVVVDLSDTTYTSAASLESAITNTISTSQTDGSLSVCVSSNNHANSIQSMLSFFFNICAVCCETFFSPLSLPLLL